MVFQWNYILGASTLLFGEEAASEAVSAEFAGYAKHPSVEVLSGEIEKIKQAVHDGVYGTRSLIGDSVLLMEHHVNELKKDGS